MATYLGPTFQGDQYESGIPLDLVMQVGAMKQARVDTNRAQIQDMLDRLGNYDIINENDREFIGSKVNNLVSNLNGLSSQNLSDSTVYNQLVGLTNDFYNDKEVYSRIANNARAAKALKNYQDTIEKHPEQYSAANEYMFRKQFDAWRTNSNNADFNAAYVPYYDHGKQSNAIMDDILKNPDIRREIEYIRNPDGTYQMDSQGNYIKRGEREVKEITQDKIRAALTHGLDERAKNQLMIDYQYKLDHTTLADAEDELRNYIDSIDTAIANVDNDVKNGRISEQAASQFRQNNMVAREAYKRKLNEVTTTGDPSRYYTQAKYLDDYVTGYTTRAYSQEGKLDDDFLFTENYKHQNAMELTKYKNDLETAQKIELAEHGIGLGGSKNKKGQVLGADGMPLTPNPLEENVFEIFRKGEGAFTGERMVAMFNGASGWDDKTGTFNVSLGDSNVFLDVQPMLSELGIEADTRAAQGYDEFQTEYKKWTQTKEGKNLRYGAPIGAAGNAGEKAGAAGAALGQYFSSKGTKQPQRIIETPKSFQEFLKTKAGQEVSNKIKGNYGLDMSSAQDVANVKKFMTSDKVKVLQDKIGTLLREKKIRGRVNMMPADGSNAFVGSDGNMYVKNFALFTEKQLEDSMGDDVDALIDNGIIQKTYQRDKDDEPIYQVSIINKVEKDLSVANMDYMQSEKGSKFFSDNAASYDVSFRDMMTNLQRLRALPSKDPDVLAGRAAENIAAMAASGKISKQAKDAAMQAIDAYQSALKSNPDKNSYIESLINLNQAATVTPEELSSGRGKTGTGSVAERHNNPGNLKYAPWMAKYGAEPGDAGSDGGRFAKFPNVGAALQAREALLQGSTYNNLTVDEAMKRYSNFDNGGYDGSIYPEIRNKKMGSLTPAERQELTRRQIQREDPTVYNKLVGSNAI